ncbi:MAG: aminoacetone oxidase family FAD-binding enzyme [Bacilli bacterium]|nr:aminoacetone oxidase family FAD-binding enzyme [Bacilli bacterium]
MNKIVIIGGGASGIFTAIMIKKMLKEQVKVTLLERLDKIGKKILASGNGRCNFTNEAVDKNKYNNPDFVKNALEVFGYQETISFFEELGLISKVLTEGRVYPVTESASAVLDVLRMALKNLEIDVKTLFEVKNIIKNKNRYLIQATSGEQLDADYVVTSTGGTSSKVLGSNGSGYDLLRKHQIQITNIVPGLVGLKTTDNLKSLDGIRVKALVKVIDKVNDKECFSELGEVQFKTEGISGIVSMQASSFIGRTFKNPSKYKLSLDLLPNLEINDIKKYFDNKIKLYGLEKSESLFTGLINKMIGLKILKDLKIEINKTLNELTSDELYMIGEKIKNFNLDIDSTYGFDKSQVTIGGVSLEEVNQKTLELYKLPNVYVTGELLDIDGECGGFNLQWAWSSASLAAISICKKIKGER